MGVGLAVAARLRGYESYDVSVAQAQPKINVEDIPDVPEVWALDAVQRHSVAERDLFLRHKIMAFAWMPHQTLYAVVHDGALQEAEQRGLHVAGNIAPQTYRAVVRRVLSSQILHRAVHGLRISRPWASARQRLTLQQICVFGLGFLLLGCLGALVSAKLAFNATLFASAGFFLMVVILRGLCLFPLPKGVGTIAAIPDDEDLPVYTVLVPLFRETAVVGQLVRSLSLFNYPQDKLDIKIILEENDLAMHHAVQALNLPWTFDVIVVPPGQPQTKPRALNYALQFAKGSLVTIYDGEDIPQPNQLKLAAARFANADDDLGCLQAALTFYNPCENWLTRQFAAEYAGLFHVVLPTLAAYELPLPLGGTSNHFRMSALCAVGAWDAFNVTEDADLGIRLARHGYKTSILTSSTFEEANTELGNWMKQRRRWLKGFLQTWLVHNRHPIQLLRETGMGGFCAVQAMTLGVFASALFHPFLLGVSLWNFLPAQVIAHSSETLSSLAAGFSLALLLTGYVAAIGVSEKGLRRIGGDGWTKTLLTIPFYWLLISVAAWLALWDFIVAPFHWHKTRHGLSRVLRVTGHG